MPSSLQRWLVSAAGGAALVLASFAASESDASRTFYLQADGCPPTSMRLTVSPYGEDGCGTIGGLPTDEVLTLLGVGATWQFISVDGVPLVIDANRDVEGVLHAESWYGDNVPGAGQVVFELALRVDTDGGEVEVGSGSFEAIGVGTGGLDVPFHFDIPDMLAGTRADSLTLEVGSSGINFNHTNLGYGGDSYLTMPLVAPGDTAS